MDLYNDVFIHLFISLFRVICGLCIGTSVATILAICINYNSKCGKLLNRIVYMLQPIPKIIFLPLFFMLFGLSEFSKIAMLSLYAFFQVFIIVRDSLIQIDSEIIILMKSMKAKKWDNIKNVIGPHSIPYIFTGLRGAIGTEFAVLFIVESYATTLGIGYSLLDNWTRNKNIELLLLIICIAISSLLLIKMTFIIENKIVRWKRIQNIVYKDQNFIK